MKVIDLTHVISEDMPVYPGTDTPKLETANTLEKDGFKETLMIMYSHTGTHMDPPAHLYADGATLDEMPITNFVGKGFVVDCTDLKAGDFITMDKINRNKSKVEEAEFILFHTGWSKYWGREEYYGKFPVADREVVEYLVKNKKKGFGVDVISIDSMEEETLPSHQIVFKRQHGDHRKFSESGSGRQRCLYRLPASVKMEKCGRFTDQGNRDTGTVIPELKRIEANQPLSASINPAYS